jgi:peptidoglycan/xylan/chitin deacetylase (PgdA/CDA1 family)
MNVTPEAFRDQMAWLAANRPVISLEDAAAGVPGVAITLDDGYLDNLTQAAPILREFGIPATVFIVAGRVGSFLDHDVENDNARLMSWENLWEWVSLGLDAGAHTMTHPRLARLSRDEQHYEIGESKRLLEKHLGRPIHAMAYPFGSAADYNNTSVLTARECGYILAVSNQYGPLLPHSDRFTLRRIWIDETDSLDSYRAKVTGALDMLALLDTRAGLAARRILNRAFHVTRGANPEE